MSYQPPPAQYGGGAPPPGQPHPEAYNYGQPNYGQPAQHGNQPYQQQQAPYGTQPPYQAQCKLFRDSTPQATTDTLSVPQYGQVPPQPSFGQVQPQSQYGAPPSGAGYQPQYNAAPGGQQYPQGPPPQPQYGQQPAYGAPGYGHPPPQPQQWQQGHPALPVSFGQPQMGYGAPSVGQVVPRTYLGSPLHPSENPLLPQHEQVRDNQPLDGYVATKDVEIIKKACKGFGTDEAKINSVLVPMPAVRLPVLRYTYKSKEGKDLEKLLEKELKGNHERVILNLLRGPLGADLHNIFKACDGVGTHEDMLTELLIGRPPLAIDLLKAAFQKAYNKSLEKTVLDELSFKTKSAMQVALLGDWHDMPNGGRAPEFENGIQPGGFAPQVNHQMIQDDLATLSKAIRPMIPELDQQPVSSIVFARSPVHLHALQQAYLQSKRVPLTRHIKQMVDGHLRDMYLLALNGAKKDTTGIWRDAKMLNKAMAGLGTRDELLTIRLVRAHWDRNRFNQVKQAYKQKTGKELANSVMKETSGDYRDALMTLVNAT
ncbi:hypothetical protein OIV83_003319 [Microbotryomycetes sp. JL201]|nr:hypothetical protein OIV83_003319 [Microbotryomycetes sp. JL201]